ncbi:MAG: hypothetical protein ACE5FI_14670 [Anaerolineales bacterium]
MGFLKKLFGVADARPADAGIYLYVRCDNCGKVVQLRIEPQYELVADGQDFRTHKTVVDTRCYRPMPAVFYFDRRQNLMRADIEGGALVDRDAFRAQG